MACGLRARTPVQTHPPFPPPESQPRNFRKQVRSTSQPAHTAIQDPVVGLSLLFHVFCPNFSGSIGLSWFCRSIVVWAAKSGRSAPGSSGPARETTALEIPPPTRPKSFVISVWYVSHLSRLAIFLSNPNLLGQTSPRVCSPTMPHWSCLNSFFTASDRMLAISTPPPS